MAVYKVTGFIYKIGINRCIDIPKEISKKLGAENFIPVVIKYGSIIKRTNLIPSGSGYHRLYIDSEIRRKAGKDAGEFIEIEISRDNKPRDTTPPSDLIEAFEQNMAAFNSFDRLTENKKREIINYIKETKNPDTRLKRINYIVARMLERSVKSKRRGK